MALKLIWKTEVLKYGLFEAIPKQYCKATIMVLGCFFGNNEFQNFQKALVKMVENIVKIGNFLNLIFVKGFDV